MHVVCSGFVRHFVLFQDHMTNVTIKVVPLESTVLRLLELQQWRNQAGLYPQMLNLMADQQSSSATISP
jgi:hypothetical protein